MFSGVLAISVSMRLTLSESQGRDGRENKDPGLDGGDGLGTSETFLRVPWSCRVKLSTTQFGNL